MQDVICLIFSCFRQASVCDEAVEALVNTPFVQRTGTCEHSHKFAPPSDRDSKTAG